MATRTKAQPKSKSERVRDLLRGGTPLAEAARQVDMGYAFAYGVMTRLAKADPTFDIRTVTGERKVKGVQITGTSVKIRLMDGSGYITVDRETAKITRSKR